MSKLYDATPAQLKAVGLKPKDAQRLYRALCTLADYEGPIKEAIRHGPGDVWSHSYVCDALRYLVDADGR